MKKHTIDGLTFYSYGHGRSRQLKQEPSYLVAGLYILAGIAITALVLDLIGALLWIASSQVPATDVFAGMITRGIINLNL